MMKRFGGVACAVPLLAADVCRGEAVAAEVQAEGAPEATTTTSTEETTPTEEKSPSEDEVTDKIAEKAAEALVDGFSAEQQKAMEEGGEKHEFQAEVSRLMDIIINSLYSDKEVFLRELISNAADALEKARFLSVQDPNFLGENKDLDIKIEFDAEARTISIIDSGVGMTKQELINNLGTVAKSGTTNFLEAMKEGSGDSSLIGQFGVGFYSAFLVADKVSVTSKNNEDNDQHVWESSADAQFQIAEDPRGATLGRGSRITLHLKEDAMELLSEAKLRSIVQKHSQFIQFPIYVKTSKEVEVEDEDADIDDDDDDEDEDEDEEKDGEAAKEKKDKKAEKPTKTTKKETVFEWEQLNTQKAIWLRSKEDVTDAEYNAFYKTLSNDHEDPQANTHFNAEGEIDFKSLLFIPKRASTDMQQNYYNTKADVKLFVRRVLVADKDTTVDLLPRYLNFIKGVVDSNDLPLNVSREQLQQDKIMKVITKKLVRKVLELFKKMHKDAEAEADDNEDLDDEEEAGEKEKADSSKKPTVKQDAYKTFFTEFGKNLKMGCIEDDANRSKIGNLLRFQSTTSTGGLVSLEKYVANMPEKQDSIYFISGDDTQTMMKSPVLEKFRKRGIQVLLMDDQLDEPCIQRMSDFEGKKFVSVQKAGLKLAETEEEKKRHERMVKFYEPLTKFWKKALAATKLGVSEVVISKRLVETPCALVASAFGHSPQQEKLMRQQGGEQSKMMLQMMGGQKTLEINGDHPIVHDLLKKVKEHESEAETETESEAMKKAAETTVTLAQTALVDSGFELTDASELVSALYKLMSQSLGVDPEAPIEEIELPEEEEEVKAEEKEEDEEEENAEEEKVEKKESEEKEAEAETAEAETAEAASEAKAEL